MLKKPMLLIMSAVMLISSAAVSATVQAAIQPLVENMGTLNGNLRVKVLNPGSKGAESVKLIVTHNEESGKVVIDGESVPQSAAAPEVTLTAPAPDGEYNYFVVDEDGASLLNAAPMPVDAQKITVSAKIKYVKLTWETPEDDFSAVKEYIIKRYDKNLNPDVTFGEGGSIVTSENRYVDPADGERNGVTLVYGITAVDFGGAKSEETKVTVTTPRYAAAYLAPTEEETAEKSDGLTFNFIDYRMSDIYNIGFSTNGGEKNGKKYRETVIYTENAAERSSTMMFTADPSIIKDDDSDVTVEVTYLDEGTHGIRFQYYKTTAAYANDKIISFGNSGEWKTAKVRVNEFSRAYAEGSKGFSNPCSFRLYTDDKTREIAVCNVRMIRTSDIGDDLMQQLYPPDPSKGASILFKSDASLDIKNCLSYTNDFYRTQIDGVTCVAIPNDGDYMAFSIDDAVLSDATKAKLTVTYYAKGEVPYIDYYSGDDKRSNSRLEAAINTGEWKVSDGTFLFKDLPFTAANYDFLIRNTGGGEGPIYISEIKIEKVTSTEPGGDDPQIPSKPDVNEGDPTRGASITFGATVAEDAANCITYIEDYDRTEYEGKTAVKIPDRSSMSFTISDAVIAQASGAKLTVEYYDGGEAPYIDYTTADGGRKNTRLENATGGGWKSAEFIFTDLPFTGNNYDFRINNSSAGVEGEPIYIAQIKVEKYEIPDPANGASIVFGQISANDTKIFITIVTDCERESYSDKMCAAIPDRRSMDFKLDPAVLEDAASAKLTIEYYDNGEAPYIGYYSSDTSQRSDGWKNTLLENATHGGWKSVEFVFTALPFTGRNYDFRINNSSAGVEGEPIYISQIKVERITADSFAE